MLDVIIDTLKDTVRILPFLFFAFLIIEFIEHRLNKKIEKTITKANKFGPLLGSLFGLLPQCGFSVMATNLYITRILSIGTLISIYLSTSDEMLPILISKNVSIWLILEIVFIKFSVGIASGILIDLIFKNKKALKENYEICETLNCSCNKGIIKGAVKHTLNIILFIIMTNFILNTLFYYIGSENISKIFLKNSVFGPFISSLVGLIPNCGSSIIITELYLSSAISFGSLISGLLSNNGIAILILFKSNKNIKENLFIVSLVYFIGVFIGVLIEFLSMIL